MVQWQEFLNAPINATKIILGTRKFGYLILSPIKILFLHSDLKSGAIFKDKNMKYSYHMFKNGKKTCMAYCTPIMYTIGCMTS